MPQLIPDDKRENALAKVNENLAEIATINKIVGGGDYDFVLQSKGGGKGKLALDSSTAQKVVIALLNRKSVLVREIKDLAKANNISFSEDENAMMSDTGHAIRVKKPKEEKKVSAPQPEEVASDATKEEGLNEPEAEEAEELTEEESDSDVEEESEGAELAELTEEELEAGAEEVPPYSPAPEMEKPPVPAPSYGNGGYQPPQRWFNN